MGLKLRDQDACRAVDFEAMNTSKQDKQDKGKAAEVESNETSQKTQLRKNSRRLYRSTSKMEQMGTKEY